MAAVKVGPGKVREIEDADAFYAWLGKNHQVEDEVWIKVYKVASGLKSITPGEALDAALCGGWIDAVRKSSDEKSYLRRYTPRRATRAA